jgi:hypothetical protein
MRDISLNAAMAQEFRTRRIFFGGVRFIDIATGSATLLKFRRRFYFILLKYAS